MKKNSILSKKITPNSKNLPFKEYYNSLPDPRHMHKGALTPKQIVRYAVADVTGKSPLTINRWISGAVIPGMLEKQAVSALLECPVDTLFPEHQPATV